MEYVADGAEPLHVKDNAPDKTCAAARGRLDVQQCVNCGTHRFPPTEGCYACSSLDWRWDTLQGTGRVYSYIWVHDPAAEVLIAST